MSIPFSETTNNTGIVQQVRQMLRVDATQYPTYRIVNSVNNYLDTVTGYAIGADRRFQWDDTNHTKLPIGTTNLVANQSDYNFLLDEQFNSILNLTRIDILDTNGNYRKLEPIDESQIPDALDEFERVNGQPIYYDKIADNIIRLYPKPLTSVTAGLQFYFQRTGSYFASTDTIKSPGVAPLLHRGFVINAVNDALLSGIGSANPSLIQIEIQKEEAKMIRYFSNRNVDETFVMSPMHVNSM